MNDNNDIPDDELDDLFDFPEIDLDAPVSQEAAENKAPKEDHYAQRSMAYAAPKLDERSRDAINTNPHDVQRKPENLDGFNEWYAIAKPRLEAAKLSIYVHSLSLQEEWLNDESCLDLIMAAARKGRLHIRFIVNRADEVNISSECLGLIKRLPGSIHARSTVPPFKDEQESLIVIDNRYVSLIKPMKKMAPSDWLSATKAQRIMPWIANAWKNGVDDANLRDIHI